MCRASPGIFGNRFTHVSPRAARFTALVGALAAALAGCAQPATQVGTTADAELVVDGSGDSDAIAVDAAADGPAAAADSAPDQLSDIDGAELADGADAAIFVATPGPLPTDATGCTASYLGEPPTGTCAVFVQQWSCPQPAGFAAAARAADGGFAVVGRIGNATWIVRSASDGKPLWQRVFPSPSYAVDVIGVANGGWVLVAAGGDSSFVARLDSNGSVVWSIALNANVAKVVQLASGGFAVAVHRFENWTSSLSLVRIDAAGGVAGASSHELYQGGWISSLIRRPDHSLAMAFTQKQGAGAYSGVLWNFDGLGLPAGQTSACKEAIVRPQADGTTLMGCNTYAYGAGVFATYVVRMNQGDQQWRTWVTSVGKQWLAFWTTTAFDAFADGASLIGSAKTETRWSRIAGDGQFAWHRQGAVAHDLLALPDGGFAAVGFAGEATQAVATVVRADRWGNAECAAATACAGLAPDACNDGNGCTSDICASAGVCTHVALDDYTPCDAGASKGNSSQTSACIGGACKDNAW